MDAFRELRDEVRKTDQKRDKQHQDLLELIRGLQGSTSQPRSSGSPVDDPSFDDRDRDFSLGDRSGSHQDRADPEIGRDQ